MTTDETRTHTTTARIVGVLFLVSTTAYMFGAGLIESLLSEPGYLLQIYPNRTQLISGVLLQVVNDAAVVSIGVLLFPIVKRQSERIALGYAITRMLECVFLVASGIATLALIGVSQATLQAGTLDASAARTLGTILVEGSTTAYQVAMGVLGLGSLPFCAVLYRSQLIPRPLAALGLVGYAALLIGSLLEIFGLNLQLLHNLPGGVFEFVLPLWLIVKGFNSSALASEAAATDRRGQDPGRVAEV